MKNHVLYSLSALLTLLSGALAGEESTKVSICQADQGGVVEDKATHSIHQSRKLVAEISHSDINVLKNFDLLAERIDHAYHKEKSITADEVEQICQGINFAAEKHRLQTRKNKEKTPYIVHPIGVAYNLMLVGEVRDSAVIIGALLHDTIEDTQTTAEEIKSKFGEVVEGYVKEVTDDKSLAQQERKRMQVINASHKSKGAALIKFADKLYNLNDLLNNPPSGWSQERVDRYFQWAQSVLDRLPLVNSKLHDATESVINSYWEKQEVKKP